MIVGFVKGHGNLLCCKKSPCLKNLHIYFVTYCNIAYLAIAADEVHFL